MKNIIKKNILKILNYFLVVSGIIILFGAVGGLDNNQLTFGQFCLYELLAGVLIFLSYIVYTYRDNNDYI